MTLQMGEKNHRYILKQLNVKAAFRQRLEALGFQPGTELVILGKKTGGAMIVRIKGSRIALGSGLTTCLEVKEHYVS